jgi:hypothetical protein
MIRLMASFPDFLATIDHALPAQLEEGFFHLKQFSEREGHCRVPYRYRTDDGYRLGSWVNNQRTAKNTMKPDRRKRLEALPGWVWDALLEQWEDGFSHLKQFSEREGHCRVYYRYKTDDNYRLGQWIGVRRRTKGILGPDRRQRLEALPGWVWDARSEQWEEGFFHLKQFSERQGHCRVPTFYNCDDSYRLGSWVSRQRRSKDTMESARRKRLKALPGWVWKIYK